MKVFSRLSEAMVMVLDVVRGYLSVASGLTDITVQRAKDLAESVLASGADAADKSQEQVQKLAEDLMEQSQTNRDLLIGLIRTEVDRAVGRMGFVREEELAAVRGHVSRLEAQLRSVSAEAAAAGMSAGGAAARTVTGAAGAVAAKVSPTRPKDVSDSQPESASTPAAPAKKTAAKKTAAKKAPAKKTTAKKAPAKKTTAKKTTSGETPAK